MASQNSEQLNNQNPEAQGFNSWEVLARRSGMSEDQIEEIRANRDAVLAQRAQGQMLPAEAAQAQIAAELPQAPSVDVARPSPQSLSPENKKLIQEKGIRAFTNQKLEELNTENERRKQNISDAFGGLRK